MSEGLIHIEICAPERKTVTMEVTEVMLPGSEGVFTVQPGHTPLLSQLESGVLVAYPAEGDPRFFAVGGGFAEVSGDRVLILAKTMEDEAQIDLDRASTAAERAENRLKCMTDEIIDFRRAEAALSRAMARVQAASRKGY